MVRGARAPMRARRRSRAAARSCSARLERGPALRPFATRDWRWTPTPRGARRGGRGVPDADRARATCSRPTSACGSRAGSRATPFDLFAAAAEALPTDRAAFVAGPWGTVASLSPEVFLTRTGRTVRSEPIKGTRPAGPPRGAGRVREGPRRERDDRRPRAQRPRARLPAGQRPRRPRSPRSAPHAGVWHLVSEVEGELRDGVGDADLLRATFPPGSVTGAPKLAALDVIAELESTGREAYTGRDRLREPARRARAERRDPHVRGPRRRGSGSARAAASSPTRRGEDEAREAAAKAAPLLAAIGARPAAGAAPGRRPPAPRVARRGPRPVPRARPRRRAVRDVLVARRASRSTSTPTSRGSRRACARSTASPLPDELAERAARRRRAATRGARLRIDVVPGEDAALVVTALARPGAGRAAARRPARRPRRRTSGATARCSRPTRPTTPPRCRCCSTPTATCSRRAGRASSSSRRDGALLHAARRRPHPARRHGRARSGARPRR